MDSRARHRRHRRARAKIQGTAGRPRVSVYRSLTRISAQLIDDEAGMTLAAAAGTPAEVATELVKQAAAKGVSQVVFDRSGYNYHGQVKAVADGLRAGGLTV